MASTATPWTDPPACGCRDGRPACSRGRGLFALVQAAYAGWEGRRSDAARRNWRDQLRRWSEHVWSTRAEGDPG